ncbi:hypothetical protein IWQ51_004126 [Labrenzia sp. EL_142]|nr:hypothetical protein [Labrenzia sp. EL_142]
MIDDNEGQGFTSTIQSDKNQITGHLGEIVRGAVKQALNVMRDAEVN